jgi:hypothetical protein
MAASHDDPSDHGGESSHSRSRLAFDDGSIVAIARLDDQYAIHVEPGTAVGVVYATRGEVRELALTLIDATQIDREEGD